ncbi:MAG TPA: hypothetical protein VGC42_30880 [Kofleriaceae bacterium]
MSEARNARISVAAARARAAMTGGATLDEVLRAFRDQDELGAIGSIQALRELSAMEMSCAKDIVSNACEGRSYAHLSLADLELLGDVPRVGGVDYFTRRHRDDAIIERKPYLLYVRAPEATRSVDLHPAAIPLAAPPDGEHAGCITGDCVTFERVCDDVRRAAAAWPTELRILRDEHDQLLLHFLRATSASEAARAG